MIAHHTKCRHLCSNAIQEDNEWFWWMRWWFQGRRNWLRLWLGDTAVDRLFRCDAVHTPACSALCQRYPVGIYAYASSVRHSFVIHMTGSLQSSEATENVLFRI
jgi:hypothetical protein